MSIEIGNDVYDERKPKRRQGVVTVGLFDIVETQDCRVMPLAPEHGRAA